MIDQSPQRSRLTPAITTGPTRPEAAPLSVVARRLVSKVALCVLYVVFAYAHLLAIRDNGFRLSLALLMLFESVMVVMVFFRRDSSEVDMGAFAVFAGLMGSFAVLGFRPGGSGEDMVVGQAIQITGAMLQIGASLSLGRSFGLVPANRGVKTAGMYRVVRHPFYMAYLVTQAGYIINNPSLGNVAVIAVGTGFQVLRIRYEERLLLRDADYRAYAATVRWHLVPGLW
ncbi:MAG: methyltransferase [Acidimicrobiales bacterium]